MYIKILYGVSGAKSARGITVIIDIYRAGTLAAYILSKKARHIIPVSTKDEVFLLHRSNPGILLMGEEEGIKIPGFHHGNSPSEISRVNLENKIVVHRSTQGTQGLVNAKKADEVIFGSFTVTSAIVRYIHQKNARVVSIMAMDSSGSEDEVYANFLQQKLLGNQPDINHIFQNLRKHRNSLRFLDTDYPQYPEADLDYCLKIDIFNFIPLLDMSDKPEKIKMKMVE